MNIVLLDVLRILGCIQASIVVCMSSWIIIRYARALKEATDAPRRVLVYHVVCIGLSYIVLTVIATVEIIHRYGSPFTWRTPLGLLAFSLGDLGLFLMLFRIVLMRKLYDETKREL